MVDGEALASSDENLLYEILVGFGTGKDKRVKH